MVPAVQAVPGRPLRLSCPECRKRGSVSSGGRGPEAVSPRTRARFLGGDDRAGACRPERRGEGPRGRGRLQLRTVRPSIGARLCSWEDSASPKGPDRDPRHHHHPTTLGALSVCSCVSRQLLSGRRLLPPGGRCWAPGHASRQTQSQTARASALLPWPPAPRRPSCAAPSRPPGHPPAPEHAPTLHPQAFHRPLLLESRPGVPRSAPPTAAWLRGPPRMPSWAAWPPSGGRTASGLCDHPLPQEWHHRSGLP